MWAAARPSSGACGADRGRSGRVGRPDSTPNRAATELNGAEPGGEAVLGAAAGVANTAGGHLGGACGPAGDGRAPDQGIAAGADGHAERIKADRTVPTYLRRHAAPARTPPRRRVGKTP